MLVMMVVPLAGCSGFGHRGPSAAPLPPPTLGTVEGADCTGKGPVGAECMPASGPAGGL